MCQREWLEGIRRNAELDSPAKLENTILNHRHCDTFFSESYIIQEFSESHQTLTLTTGVSCICACMDLRTACSCGSSPLLVRRATVFSVPEITITQNYLIICFPRRSNI